MTVAIPLRVRRAPLFVGLIVLGLLLSGCAAEAAQEELGSRATLYDSVHQLADDSTAVVIATVTAQDDMSISGSDGTVSELAVADRAAMHVFQYGSEVVSASAPLLEAGHTYLLFLSAGDLPGIDDNEYYVTGSSAGVYERTARGFERRGAEADTIPDLISEDEAEGLLR